MNKYRKHNYYYGAGGGLHLPEGVLVEDTEHAGKKHYKYVGTFREYTPIARTITHFNNDLVLEVRKQYDKPNTDFDMIPFIQTGGGYHSSDFNSNGRFSISKKVLQEIVDKMGDNDELVITAPDTLNRVEFDRVIKEIKDKQ